MNSSFHGHLDCFQYFAIMNNVAMIIENGNLCVDTLVLLGVELLGRMASAYLTF